MVIKIHYKDFIKKRNDFIDGLYYKSNIRKFLFSHHHEIKLQKIIEEDVNYLFVQILEKELPWQIHMHLFLASSKYGGFFDSSSSDENHIHINMNGDHVIDFLKNMEKNKAKFRTLLLHELIHATDMANLKIQDREYDLVKNDIKYMSLKWPLLLLRNFRNEGVATLCTCLLSHSYHEFYKSLQSLNLSFCSNFGNYLSELFSFAENNRKKAEECYNELFPLSYEWFSRIILCKVLKNLGLISQSTFDTLYQNGKLDNDTSVQVFKACLSLSLSQYISGLTMTDEFEEGALPMESLLSLCAKVQEQKDENKMSLFTLLMEIPYPSAKDFIDVLNELVIENMTDDELEQNITALRDLPKDTSSNLLDVIDKIYGFYLRHKEDHLQSYATAARLVLNYYFSQSNVIHNDVVGFGRVDNIMLLYRLLRLLQLDVFSSCFDFERNDTGNGLIITGYKGWSNEEDYPVAGLGSKDMYIPTRHEFEGEILPVVAIKDNAQLGDNTTYSVIVPTTVTHIGDNAFISSENISHIKVECGNPVYDSRQNCDAIIETATNTLFMGCTKTKIPYSVESIGDHAMDYVRGTSIGVFWSTYITVPDSVTYISENAFAKCKVDTIYISNPSLIKIHNRKTRIVKV